MVSIGGMLHHIPNVLFLAQADVPVVAWASFVVSSIVAVLMIVQHFRPNPPNHDRYARREAAEKLDTDLKALRVEVSQMVTRDEFAELGQKIDQGQKNEVLHYERILDSGSKRAGNIYARIDAVNDRLGTLAVAVARLEALARKPGDTNGTD